MTTEERKEKFLVHLRDKLGIVKSACMATGIDRKTYYNWIIADEEFKKKSLDIQEDTIDFVESKLFETINQGNVTSIIFYLKTKAKSRGYIEQIDINKPKERKVDLSKLSDEDLKQILKSINE